MRTPRRAVLGAAAALLLAGCGFRMRGALEFGYRRLHLSFAPGSSTGRELRRQLLAGGQVELVDAPQNAEVVLRVLEDAIERSVSVQTGAGQIRGILVRARVRFTAQTAGGRELIPETQLALERNMSYNESQALAKESEEALIVQSMQADLAAQLVRRLAALRP